MGATNRKTRTSFLLLILSGTICFAQNDTLLPYFQKLDDHGLYNQIVRDYQLVAKYNKIQLTGEHQFLIGSAFENLNKEDSAFHYYKLAKKEFLKDKKMYEVAKMNLEISSLLDSQNNLSADSTYFNEFWEYANSTKNVALLAQGYNYKGRTTFLNKNYTVPLNHFKVAYKLFDSIGDSKMASTNLMNVGVVFSGRIKNQDSAQYYYFQALNRLNYEGVQQDFSNLKHDLLNNIGNSFRRSRKYYDALKYYKKAETLEVKKYKDKTKKILYGNMNLTYYYLADFKNAYTYLHKYDSIKDIINLAQQNATISDIQEKYDNEKLRADNLEIEKRRLANRNWLIAASLALFLGAGIAILLQKNTIKKRQLAEQEALLKQQRVENLFKEQELVSIDAMISGQEKERQKVAGELHDDLGSLMATIKLHFDKAGTGAKDPALQNAQKLLEEAYQKIRRMAHSKNSGVMSDQGLLPAIKKMAKSISESNTLQVSVEDFGMGDRLENSLELSIFRMVQELVANAIKHAEASKVNIQLTQHEDNLNIIVEDNGKGFNRSQVIKEKSGMGLTNIEKRVEHLEGNFTVDSVLGKGTSILIDIPV
ncbi:MULTISPECIES: sensor histidine kinase [Flavobacteriaceae]|uniref:sensor histidine kinase n=1 Tax=Flavobacteriaceae TaxID=49546 RepID=UPI00234BBEEF|nr:sensor histidine kinase [Muricauda sp. SP22]MDC6362547.1 sensor histidine kinase [Muricauda sp. SP22]